MKPPGQDPLLSRQAADIRSFQKPEICCPRLPRIVPDIIAGLACQQLYAHRTQQRLRRMQTPSAHAHMMPHPESSACHRATSYFRNVFHLRRISA